MAQAYILGLASDLFFAPKIDAATKALGYSTNWVAEYRSVAEFLQLLQTEPPFLVILDVNSSLPWIEWLPAAKADAATSSIPWLVFGSHMNPRRLAAAKRAGADKVVPKSQFNSELTELIKALI